MLTVYSTHGSPGASTTALHLAAHWASTGREVLLIEADPAGGSLSHNLGIQFTPGSASFLASGMPVVSSHLIDHSQDVLFENLHVMPAPGSPAGARGIFETLAEAADALRAISAEMAVVIDGGRITADTAASRLTMSAAGVLVVCSNTTQLESIEHFNGILAIEDGSAEPRGFAASVGNSPLSPDEWNEYSLTYCGAIEAFVGMSSDLSMFLNRNKRKSKKWKASVERLADKLYEHAHPADAPVPRAAAPAAPAVQTSEPPLTPSPPVDEHPEPQPSYEQPTAHPEPQPPYEQAAEYAEPQPPYEQAAEYAEPQPPYEQAAEYAEPQPPYEQAAEYEHQAAPAYAEPQQPDYEPPPEYEQPGAYPEPQPAYEQAAEYAEPQPPANQQPPHSYEQPGAYAEPPHPYEQSPAHPAPPPAYQQPGAYQPPPPDYPQPPPQPAYEPGAPREYQQPPPPPAYPQPQPAYEQPGAYADAQPPAYVEPRPSYQQPVTPAEPPPHPRPTHAPPPAGASPAPAHAHQPAPVAPAAQQAPGTPAADPAAPMRESQPEMTPSGSFRDWAAKLYGAGHAAATGRGV